MIEICNLRKEKPKYPYDVKVDRSSVLGNPFYMRSESERSQVCWEYEFYFRDKVENNNEKFMNELNHLLKLYEEYGQLRLFCWCSPLECHAETIRGWIIDTLLNRLQSIMPDIEYFDVDENGDILL